MQYKAYLSQKQEGCDYTIGCGNKIINIEAKNLEQANQKLITEIIENYNNDEIKIDLAVIYEVNTIYEVPIIKIQQEIEKLKVQEKKREKEETEWELYQKLKRKFE